MSKLMSGEIRVASLDVVREAALLLGWNCLSNQAVSYFYAEGPVCELVVSPSADEQDNQGRPVGKLAGGKYTVGFRQGEDGKITMHHDNAMNGREVYSLESGQTDETTQRVVGRMMQAIAQVEVTGMLRQQRASWRVEQRKDGAKALVVGR